VEVNLSIQHDGKGHVIIGEAALSLALGKKKISVNTQFFSSFRPASVCRYGTWIAACSGSSKLLSQPIAEKTVRDDVFTTIKPRINDFRQRGMWQRMRALATDHLRGRLPARAGLRLMASVLLVVQACKRLQVRHMAY
jgi:hypothetical protein